VDDSQTFVPQPYQPATPSATMRTTVFSAANNTPVTDRSTSNNTTIIQSTFLTVSPSEIYRLQKMTKIRNKKAKTGTAAAVMSRLCKMHLVENQKKKE
jgi:hypothetical protein